MSKTLMIQGTTSDAGKSTLVTGLCRLLYRRGIKVAPFKPQNMALNSAVTIDGGEIGRAQAVQAHAAGIAPHSDMNPILIKPNSDTGAQIIVHGQVVANMEASYYQHYKAKAMTAVLESHQRLSKAYDRIVVEGAGSPAEINLRDHDIANMGFAEVVDCPVVLVADIDRGGVFAHIVGTLELLSESERKRITGFVINRFRGDLGLLQPGLDWLSERTRRPVFGVLPYLHGLHLEAEDAIQTRQQFSETGSKAVNLRVIIPVLPRMSNHTDFDSLRLHPQVDLQFVDAAKELPAADLIILPGSKSVSDDLAYLLRHDWKNRLQKHLRYGGKVMGICGGYQMLGRYIHDPHQIESHAGTVEALGMLDMETTLTTTKQLQRVSGTLVFDSARVDGYDIHAGQNKHGRAYQVFANLNGKEDGKEDGQEDGRKDGVISDDNSIIGSYVHGLFDCPEACSALLSWSGLSRVQAYDYPALREQGIDLVADTLEQHLDIEAMLNGGCG